MKVKRVKLVGGPPHTWVDLVQNSKVVWPNLFVASQTLAAETGLDPDLWPRWSRYGRAEWSLRVGRPYGVQVVGTPTLDSSERRFCQEKPDVVGSIRGTENLWVPVPCLKEASDELLDSKSCVEHDAQFLGLVGQDLGLWKVEVENG